MEKTPQPSATATCHFRAEMDGTVILGHVATIEVVVSREALERAVGDAAAAASGPVDLNRRIEIMVLPKVNFENAGNKFRDEIDPPAPRSPAKLTFDVRATHEGTGEILVLAIQGQAAIATLTLRPKIEKTRSAGRKEPLRATASPGAPGILKAILSTLHPQAQTLARTHNTTLTS